MKLDTYKQQFSRFYKYQVRYRISRRLMVTALKIMPECHYKTELTRVLYDLKLRLFTGLSDHG